MKKTTKEATSSKAETKSVLDELIQQGGGVPNVVEG
ncbi:MAG: hypothetical protein GAK41_01054 [Burkholderia gladioli]|nr:MAG: hypothetical protein GAK41_01054 [Burkholderia gladioli]